MAFDAHGAVQGKPNEAVAPIQDKAPPVETSTPTETPKAAAPAPSETPPAPMEPPPFTPDFKLKVMGKDYEVPEMFRGLVKDEESLKSVREIFNKAYGLDESKPRFEAARSENNQLKEILGAVQQDINELKGYYQEGDFDSFFEKLNIPVAKVLDWLQAKANYQEMPPEQRALVDARRNESLRARQLEQQNQALSQNSYQQQVQALEYMLNLTLEQPDTKAFAEKFDAAQNRPGAFMEQVIEYGRMAYAMNQQMVLPAEAVKAVRSRYEPFLAQQTPQPPATVIPTEKAVPPAQKPGKGLPTIQSRSSTQVSKTRPRSIDDLKALHSKMVGA